MGITRRTALSAMALSGIGVAPAMSQPVDEFYRGKSLTLVVGADAGTPTDIIARQFAQTFVKYVPGKPDPVVLNVIGAGGMVAAGSLQSKQRDDGTVIGFLQRNNLYIPLLDPRQNVFDPRRARWLGSLSKVEYCIVAMTRAGATSADDLFRKKIYLGATGFSNENRMMPALLNQYLGTKLSIVPGYTGRGEVYLAMQRGEVDGWASTVDGLNEGEPARMIAQGKMKVLLHLGWSSPPEFPDVPNLSTYVRRPEVRALFDFFLLPFQAGRPLAVPGAVPPERLAALRGAFARTVADPKFVTMMKKQGYPVDAIDGGSVERIVSQLYATSAPALDGVRRLQNPES